jgi:hypothetical protein
MHTLRHAWGAPGAAPNGVGLDHKFFEPASEQQRGFHQCILQTLLLQQQQRLRWFMAGIGTGQQTFGTAFDGEQQPKKQRQEYG